MPNPIKYSTGSESLALKKGNFYIGTGDVGKGPTSSTGYYNGIDPPSGGYTIYLNKATGGPSIYTASDDTQLISLTNSIAGQSYTTANECLTYFAGQTDKLCVNRDYEGIVTNGLVLNLDAGFTPSYPKNGTSIYDISTNTYNGTLTNGPTFNSDNGGSIVFDGVDDYVINSDYTDSNSSVGTICGWLYPDSTGNSDQYVLNIGGTTTEGATRAIRIVNGNWVYATWGSTNQTWTVTPVNFNTWAYVVITWNGTSLNFYLNSTNYNATRSGVITPFSNVFKLSSFAGILNERPFKGKSGSVQIYNRVLSATEVLQNYNAQKGRFGL